MDSMQVSVVRRNLRLDGIRYELTALCVDGENFQAIWHCPKCNVGGSSVTTFARSNLALDWAEKCASKHELESHSGPVAEGDPHPLPA